MTPQHQHHSSGAGLGLLAIVIALVFIIGPMAAPFITGPSRVILVGFGVFLLVVGSIIVTITRLYRKTAADEAFVRTGMGGQKPVIDGGAIVIPVVHEVIPVSLQTMKLIVTRSGENALITGDNLRADVTAEFFIKVQKQMEDVLAAATSLGQKAINPKEVESTVFEKLVNALRTVGATKQLAELHTKRDDFASAVQAIVEKDLKHNGLTLESVTISKLDQTPTKDLRPEDNVFDAQGARRIAEITNQAKIERNRIEREADQRVKEQDVQRDLYIYQKDVERAAAEAERDKNIRVVKAKTDQEAASATSEQARLAGIAEVEKNKGISVADIQRAKAIEVGNQDREKAAQTAQIEKEKAVQLATREKEIAVAEAEKRRADAEALRLAAETEAERKRQEVKTVEVEATAMREKNKVVITQQAEIEKTRLQEQMEADVKAYAVIKAAEGEQEAASRTADARLTLAEAEKTAKALTADGDKAAQMVPVEVDRERVNVEQARVDVKREELKNQAEFESIARDLQIDLARIEAEKQAKIAAAEAFGAALAKANMTLWGDPSTVARMSEAFFAGQQNGRFLGGLSESMPHGVKESVSDLARLLNAALERLTGVKTGPQNVAVTMPDVAGKQAEAKES